MEHARKMEQISLRLIASLAISLFATMGNTAPNGAEWKWSGEISKNFATPRISGKTTGTREKIRMTAIKEFPEGTTVALESRAFGLIDTVAYSLPRPQRDSYVHVKFYRDDASTAALFSWSGLVRPAGMALIDYKGQPGYEAPDDFEAYWDRAKTELAAVPLQPVLTRQPDKDTTAGLLYRVDLLTVEETTVVAWLYVPRKASDSNGTVKRKYPAVILVPGYGGAMKPIDRTWDDYITLSVNPRSHGASREYWAAPVTHLAYRITEPEKYYYRQAMLDCLRGAQFLFERPEVDPKRVGTAGGSQGGLFAISTAALEPRIACVVSNVTSWCAFADRQKLAHTGTQRVVNDLLEKAAGETSEPLVHRSLAMTDAANLATLVKCPVQVNMGGIDMVCPWPTGIVLFNRLPEGVIREFNISPEAGHTTSPKMKKDARRWQRRFLEQ